MEPHVLEQVIPRSQENDPTNEKGNIPSEDEHPTKKNSSLPDENLSEIRKQDALIFSKRKGTVNKGKEYEKYFVTNFMLKWLKSDKIVDFRIWSNDKAFEDLDDVILEVKYSNNSEEKFALQLKHHNDSKYLTLNSLEAERGNFAIKKYFESYKKNQKLLDNYQLILWTNLVFSPEKNKNIRFSHDGFTFNLQMTLITGSSILSANAKCYKFDFINNDDKFNILKNNPKFEEYERFFENFFLYSDQKNFDNLKTDTIDAVEKLFPNANSLLNNFIEYVNNWTLTEGVVWKLNKDLITKVVALQLLTNYIVPFSSESMKENKLLQDAIDKFHLTVFKHESSELVSKIWNNDRHKLINNKEANIFLKQYQLSRKHKKIDESLNDTACSILLWIIEERPLIVKSSPSTYEAIKLLKDKKFILIQENTDHLPKHSFKIFRKLSDLEQFEDIFSNITNEIRFKLPGKKTNLSTLIQKHKKIADIITTDELLTIVDEKFEFRQQLEKVPEPYIKRSLYRNYININYLDESKEEVLILVSNVKKENERLECFSRCELIQLEDFLKGRQKKSNIQHSVQSRKVFINRKESSHKEFHQLSQKTQNNTEGHHFKFTNGKLEWIESIGEISKLNQHIIENSFINVDEDMFSKENSHNNVNIVIADSGMGKSILLKAFKNNLLSQHLIILFTPKETSKLCKQFSRNDFDKLIKEIAFPNCTTLEDSVLRYLIREGHVGYLWDALDEMTDDERSTLTDDIIPYLSKLSKFQVVTARRHLKKNLEHKFGVFSRNIQPFDSDQQTQYIKKRLEKVIQNKDILEDISNKIKTNVSTNSHIDILGIPLQIYMVTALFLENPQKYTDLLTEIFCLADLYHYFIEEKFNIYFKEKFGSDGSSQQLILLNSIKSERIKNYTAAALKTLFGNEFLVEQNIVCDDFLNDVITNGDVVGMIVDMRRKELLPEFVHTSYGEYFTALYLVDNCKKISNLDNFIFDPKHTNVRFFFDMILAKKSPPHMAVLCENMNELIKYEGSLNNVDPLGRSLLHIASSWSEQYPLLNVYEETEETETTYWINDESGEYSVKLKDTKHKQLLEYLLENCDPEKKDSLLGYTCVMYAEKSRCLFALALIENRRKSDYYKTKSDEFVCNMLYYGVKYKFADTLDVLLDNAKYVSDSDDNSLLHIATLNNDIRCVQKLLSCSNYRQHIDDENIKEERPLYTASKKNHLEIVKFLLQNDANPNLTTSNRELTPLHAACLTGNPNVAKILIKNYANVNAFSDDGATPLMYACQPNKILKEDLDSDSEDELYNILESEALKLDDTDECLNIVKILIENNADVNLANTDNETALCYACLSDNVEVVKLLVKNNAIINLTTNEGITPLAATCLVNNLSIAEILVENEAQINSVEGSDDDDKILPLGVACVLGNYDMVEFLIENNADVNSTNHEIFTPLHYACKPREVDSYDIPQFCVSKKEYLAIIKILINKNANVNAVGDQGITPLHLACSHNEETHKNTDSFQTRDACGKECVDAVKFLIENLANINATTDEGETPLSMACQNGNFNIAKFLIENNASIDMRQNEGKTPLFIACEKGYVNIVVLLISKNAEVNITTNEGETPLFAAFKNNHLNIVDILLENKANISTAADIACFKGYLNVAKSIIENEAYTYMGTNMAKIKLFVGCYDGDINIVENLVKDHVHIGAKMDDGRTPLHVACEKGCSDIVTFLIENNADVNSETNDGETPLFIACQKKHLDVVKTLVENNADLATTADVACSKGRPDLVHILTENFENIEKKNVNKTFFKACQLGDVDTVEKLIENNNVNIHAPMKDGKTSFFVACQNGNLDVIKVLIDNDVDIDTPTNDGETSLYVACSEGHLDIVKLLIDNDVNVNAATKEGKTPLLAACQNGHLEIANILVTNKANIDVAADVACEQGHLNIVDILIDIKTEVEKVTKMYTKMLFNACRVGNLAIVKKSIKNNANINATADNGKTPLLIACQSGDSDVVEFLLENNASIDTAMNDGRTPLYVACEEGHLDVVKILIVNKADVNKAINDGTTPLYVACKERHFDIVTILIENNANTDVAADKACEEGDSHIFTILSERVYKLHESRRKKEN